MSSCSTQKGSPLGRGLGVGLLVGLGVRLGVGLGVRLGVGLGVRVFPGAGVPPPHTCLASIAACLLFRARARSGTACRTLHGSGRDCKRSALHLPNNEVAATSRTCKIMQLCMLSLEKAPLQQ